MGAHVIGHTTEVFANNLGTIRRCQYGAQTNVSIGQIGGFVFPVSSGLGDHPGSLPPVTSSASCRVVPQKLVVPLWPPWECINTVKTKNVIDAKDMKYFHEFSNPPRPPRKPFGLHFPHL